VDTKSYLAHTRRFRFDVASELAPYKASDDLETSAAWLSGSNRNSRRSRTRNLTRWKLYQSRSLTALAKCIILGEIGRPRWQQSRLAEPENIERNAHSYGLITQRSGVQIPPQPLSKTAARIEPSRSPAAAANILPRFPNTISLLQRRFLSGESRD